MDLTTYGWIGIALACVVLAALALYWLLVTTEGTYLGAGIVAWLYDLTAHKYDRIKAVRYPFELQFLGIPLVQALQGRDAWHLLDVATGTGRIARALDSAGAVNGRVFGIDRSVKMMQAANPASSSGLVTEIAQQDARHLGFQNAVFDAVSCLEALEFMPQPKQAILEMLRVLKPGGVLLITNRVGLDARFFPGRLCGRGKLENYLLHLGFENVHSGRWQVYYDLIWANKPLSEG
jgi:ubiquinone/menaquinone biosynthesis C-methylase UbiE